MAFFGLFGGKQNPDNIAMGGPGALATFPEMKQPKQNDGQLHVNPKLAALSQIFASLSGRQSPVLGLLLQQQAEQRRQQQLEQARQAGMQDWQTKQEWLQAHPSPAAPTEFERKFNWWSGLPKSQQAQVADMQAQLGPPIVQQNANGTATIYPRNMFSGGAAAGGNLPRVSDQASYDAIPAGGQYYDPQGNLRTKAGYVDTVAGEQIPVPRLGGY